MSDVKCYCPLPVVKEGICQYCKGIIEKKEVEVRKIKEYKHNVIEIENSNIIRLGLELNKVHQGDALLLLKNIPDGSIDAVITDPPYFIEKLKENMKESTLRSSNKNNIFHAEWDSAFETLDNFKEWTYLLLLELKRVLRDKGQVYMFMNYHHISWLIGQINELGFRYYKPLIWYKPDTMGVFPNQYGCNYEVILWFRKEGELNNVILNIGNSQRDVFQFNSTNNKYRQECGFHPTAKPIKLVRQLIENCTNENDIVLDPFAGSGTTLVASQQIKRRFIGIEQNPEYIKTIEKRLSQKQVNNWFNNPIESNDEMEQGEGGTEQHGE